MTALVDVSLIVPRGELVAIMGPSGSGKTTLLSLAGGLDQPDVGSVHVQGVDLATLNPTALAELRRRNVGYIFQQFNLVDGLTALENVSLPLELDGVRRREARRQARRALEEVGIDEMASRLPDELSGGEQQRVAIARATIGQRVLLLADEPTGALDSSTGEAVIRLLRLHCERGGSAVLVTHDPRFAGFADRTVFLQDGRLRIEPQTSASGGSDIGHTIP